MGNQYYKAAKEPIVDVQMSISSLVSAETNLWRLLVLMDRSRMSIGLFTVSPDWGLEGLAPLASSDCAFNK